MMRTMEWKQQEELEAAGLNKQWNYALLIEDIEVEGFHCESYGLLVTDPDTGEEAVARHITVNAAEALGLLNTAARLAVSPVTLMDVVQDYLGR